MSRNGTCLYNGATENFFGRLKVELFYGERFETADEFVRRLREYIDYWNNERISRKITTPEEVFCPFGSFCKFI